MVEGKSLFSALRLYVEYPHHLNSHLSPSPSQPLTPNSLFPLPFATHATTEIRHHRHSNSTRAPPFPFRDTLCPSYRRLSHIARPPYHGGLGVELRDSPAPKRHADACPPADSIASRICVSVPEPEASPDAARQGPSRPCCLRELLPGDDAT